MKKYEDFEGMVFFCSLRGNSRFEHGSVIVHNIFAYLALSLSASQVYMIQERCWFFQINFFIEYFPHRIKILFLSSQFDVIHITSIPNWKPCPNRRIFSNCLSKIVLPKDDRTDFVQEERLGLPYWTMILAICVVVEESKCLDTPILEFSKNCEHLPFLLGYKLILRLLLVHRNLAIWR